VYASLLISMVEHVVQRVGRDDFVDREVY
jgi:hypothetical protein